MAENDKSIVICSNYAWTIYNFRMHLIKELKNLNYKIIVITQLDGYEKYLTEYVDEVIPLFISRKGINPFVDFITFLDLFIKFRKLRPKFVLLFTIKPVIYGSIASRILNIKSISMITGLGTAFLQKKWLSDLVKRLYKIALKKSYRVFFQNVDDQDIFERAQLVDSNISRLVPGSGIDLKKFSGTELKNEESLTFSFIGRMIRDKGVNDFIEAAKIVKAKKPNVIFNLIGPLNVENRSAINQSQIKKWVYEGFVNYLGETNDIINLINKSSCIVLPSYREGTSRVLLEAASLCRPIIASDVPGCREVIENGYNGYLFEVRNPNELSSKIFKMISLSHDERKQMGLNGRKKMEREFDQNFVTNEYLEAIKFMN
ncbi:MAG: glycosyltransferase family 4 protein [Pseudomonadota bacterium]|nr:glycosyltransferase family 4 protein [Pseudomonadota bacterium]